MSFAFQVCEGYPKQCLLINGQTVLFKPLVKEDHAKFSKFFLEQIYDQEVERLKHDVRDPAVISSWINALDYSRVFPLIAMTESTNQLAGVASLHFMAGVQRHVADIRAVVGKDYRKLGLGSALIKELVRVSHLLEIHFLRAEIVSDYQFVIKAFRQLGFHIKCTLEDYYMGRNGNCYDVILMMKRLHVNLEGDLFFQF